MLLKALALAPLVLLGGCPFFDGDDDGSSLPECAVLDQQNVMLVASDFESTIQDITDGSQVDLLGAPQGGHILLVGARVQAANDCKLEATASLRDMTSSRVIGLEQRSLLLERHSDGWAVPRQGLDAMPNVAVCPSAAATTSIDGHAYRLEVALATLSGTPIVTASATITPTCAVGDNYCHSDCTPSPGL